MSCRPPLSTLFPYTTLFRSLEEQRQAVACGALVIALRCFVARGFGAELGVHEQFDAAPGQQNFILVELHVIARSEEHTSELQSLRHLVCRLLLEKKKIKQRH